MAEWVLVVDDDPMVALLVGVHVGGLDVVEADDLATARQLLAGDVDDLRMVVLDHRLPDGSGVDAGVTFLEGLRSRGSDAPVVMMSGLVDEVLRERADEHGLALLDKREMERLREWLPEGDDT